MMTADQPAQEDIFKLYTDENVVAAPALLDEALKVQAAAVLQHQLDVLWAAISRSAERR